jgi:hypothetical protein
MSATNYQRAVEQICDLLGLSTHTSPVTVIAKVRELKATADHCDKSRPAEKSDALAISYRRHTTGTRDHRIA